MPNIYKIITKSISIYARYMPNIYQIYQIYCKYIPNIYQTYTKYILSIYQLIN